MQKKVVNLPDDNHVMRYVSWTRLLKDEDDNVLGFFPEAFQLRDDEEYLSVNWVEYFSPSDNQIRDCIWSMRKTRSVGKKSAFGIGNVKKIKDVAFDRGSRIRIVPEPTDSDPAHSGIHRLPSDDLRLLSALAEEALLK